MIECLGLFCSVGRTISIWSEPGGWEEVICVAASLERTNANNDRRRNTGGSVSVLALFSDVLVRSTMLKFEIDGGDGHKHHTQGKDVPSTLRMTDSGQMAGGRVALDRSGKTGGKDPFAQG